MNSTRMDVFHFAAALSVITGSLISLPAISDSWVSKRIVGRPSLAPLPVNFYSDPFLVRCVRMATEILKKKNRVENGLCATNNPLNCMWLFIWGIFMRWYHCLEQEVCILKIWGFKLS